MKVIIAGGRADQNGLVYGLKSDEAYVLLLTAILTSKVQIKEVVCGGATGFDALGERYAKQNNLPYTVFPPDWETYGKAAGPIRNAQMARYADYLIAVWDGHSPGTQNMIIQANRMEIDSYIHFYEPLKENH